MVSKNCSHCPFFKASAKLPRVGYCSEHLEMVRGCDRACPSFFSQSSNDKLVIRYLNRQGRTRWIANILPLEFTAQKAKAWQFSESEAEDYLDQVGINFASIESP